jgi:hypothetical protein
MPLSHRRTSGTAALALGAFAALTACSDDGRVGHRIDQWLGRHRYQHRPGQHHHRLGRATLGHRDHHTAAQRGHRPLPRQRGHPAGRHHRPARLEHPRPPRLPDAHPHQPRPGPRHRRRRHHQPEPRHPALGGLVPTRPGRHQHRRRRTRPLAFRRRTPPHLPVPAHRLHHITNEPYERARHVERGPGTPQQLGEVRRACCPDTENSRSRVRGWHPSEVGAHARAAHGGPKIARVRPRGF